MFEEPPSTSTLFQTFGVEPAWGVSLHYEHPESAKAETACLPMAVVEVVAVLVLVVVVVMLVVLLVLAVHRAPAPRESDYHRV